MRVKTIVWPKGIEPTRKSLKFTRTQIEDFIKQDASNIPVYSEHDNTKQIGKVIKFGKNSDDQMTAELDITDDFEFNKVMSEKYIGASVGMDIFCVNDPCPTVVFKVINEVSLTSNPDRKEALIQGYEHEGINYEKKGNIFIGKSKKKPFISFLIEKKEKNLNKSNILF